MWKNSKQQTTVLICWFEIISRGVSVSIENSVDTCAYPNLVL